MQNIFITILNMSIVGSYIIILALIARFFLRSVAKKYSYILWIIVFIRLALPFYLNLGNIFNFSNSYEINNIFNRIEYIPQKIGWGLINLETTTTNMSFSSVMITFLSFIWVLGFIGIILYEAIGYINARNKLATAIKIRDNVFETDQVSIPLIFGLIKPKIYVPVGITEKELEYVLCHEIIHIKRKDYLIKLFAYFMLAIHWFNPFVWLAFKYMSIDIEMSCDDKVLISFGNSVRKEYAETIFNFSQTKIKITRSMLAFGESDTRKRVSNVLNKKKNTRVKIMVIIAGCSVIIFGLLFSSSFNSLFSFIGNRYSNWEIKRLAMTDLSNITVDNIKIGTNIKDVDLSIYKESNRFINRDGDHTYYFDELVLDVDNDKISYIFAFVKDAVLNINGSEAISTIDEITDLLGDSYLEEIEDGAQHLMKHIYHDSEIGVVAEFIYSDYDRQFVWITLRKMQ